MKTDESIAVTVDRSGKTESRRICQARNGLRYIKVLNQIIPVDDLAADPELVVRMYEDHEANRPVHATLKLLVRCPKCGYETLICTTIDLPNALYKAPRDDEHERLRVEYINREYAFTDRHDACCTGEPMVVEIVN